MAVLRVFHQGQSNDGWLWMNEFNGTKWAGDANVPIPACRQAPAPSRSTISCMFSTRARALAWRPCR